MAKMQKKNLNTSPDETRTFEKGENNSEFLVNVLPVNARLAINRTENG